MRPQKVGSFIQEIAFRRVHHMLGIPLKHGKEDLAQCIQALGHEIAATALWAGLRMTDERRLSVFLKIGHTLAHGFKPLEVSVLAGHLHFALLATAGKASKSFARTIYEGVVGAVSDQPSPVYRALQWLEAIMQKPPPRIERTKFAKHHLLLPDGHWDPPKKEGGVGAVLLREGDLPYTYGGMVPEHLAFQLLFMQEGQKRKEQRNTQAELLAVLVAILMWHDDLQGQPLLILTDSTEAQQQISRAVTLYPLSCSWAASSISTSGLIGCHQNKILATRTVAPRQEKRR